MKKIIIGLFAFMATAGQAQSFYKGALVADLAYGFDAYVVHYNTELRYNGSVIGTQKKIDGAASSGPSIGVQYGLAKWFGLGLRAKLDNYVTKEDSITHIKPTAKGFEFGLIADFHVVRREHFNLALGFDLGTSSLNYKTNDPASGYMEVYGRGSWVNFHIVPRYYFGRFGIGIGLNFPTINYPQMTTSDKTVNTYVFSSWKGSGFGMNFAIQYRFLNSK
jgi:hypothetical protein